MPMLRSFIPLLLCALALASCSRRSADGADAARLGRIADFVSSDPRRAADSLALIDAEKLSDPDRALFGLLSVKAADKADIRHTSDSLILSVIRFYTDNPPADPLLLPEALYYGGRVSSDLGDYPRALRCFHDALAALPSSDNSLPALDLRARILGQTANLLQNLRMYTEAVPYIAESIVIDHQLNDSLTLTYDLKLLGMLHTWSHRYRQADSAFAQALEAARSLPDEDIAIVQGEWANLKRKQGDIDSALLLISSVPHRIGPEYKSYYILTAAEIYLDAGRFDSAFSCARKVIRKDADLITRSTAYRILLEEPLRRFSPPDSLLSYIDSLNQGLQRRFNSFDAESAIVQNASYNYSAYELENKDLIQRHSRLLVLTLFSISVALTLVLIVVIGRLRNARLINRLRVQIERLHAVNSLMPCGSAKSGPPSDMLSADGSVSALRDHISREIENLLASDTPPDSVPDSVLSSPAYRSILELLSQRRPLTQDSPLWDGIDRLVSSLSPDFRMRLVLLAAKPLSEDDIRLAMLIRLGLTPGQIATLIGRSKSTVSYRRRQLHSAAFCTLCPFDHLDSLILHL